MSGDESDVGGSYRIVQMATKWFETQDRSRDNNRWLAREHEGKSGFSA